RRRAVEVKIVLLDVFAVIPLQVGQAEHPLLEDRIPLIPERDRQADSLLLIAEPGQAVLVPPIGAAAGVIMRKVVPGIPIGAVVLADCSPRALAQLRAAAFPVGFGRIVLQQSVSLGVRRHIRSVPLVVAWPRRPK